MEEYRSQFQSNNLGSLVDENNQRLEHTGIIQKARFVDIDDHVDRPARSSDWEYSNSLDLSRP